MKREKQYTGVVPVVIDAFTPEIPANRALVPGCSVCLRTDKPVCSCVYCGALVCDFDSFQTDQWDLDRFGIPLGLWMCVECACK